MTNQQGAPEALTAAQIIARFEREDGYRLEGAVPREWALEAYNELRRLAALVEAQQPAPSAAAIRALDAYNSDTRDADPGSPLERLRFFCSLAMNGQDWRDAEQFFNELAAQPSPAPQADSQPAPVREEEREAFKAAHRHLELDEVPDAWGRPTFKHSHVEASWLGWIARAARAPADSVTAPAGGGVAGPSKWTDEEIADGKRGIRWVTEGVIHGRPTDHDVREYLMRTPAMRGCLCDDCKTFYAPTPPAPADSVLEDAALPAIDRAFLERTLSAMEGVLDVADRKTDEFDALRCCVVDLTVALFRPVPRGQGGAT